MIYCPNCGTTNEKDAKFCKSCGRTLDDAAATAAAMNPETGVEGRANVVRQPLGDDGLPAGVDLDGEPGGERVVWSGRPQLPLSWWDALTIRYKLTNERLIIHRGFISKSTEQLELYRVNDVDMKQSVIERLFGIGDVRLVTTDATDPDPQLKDIRTPDRVMDLIRTASRAERQRRRVLLRDEV